MKKRKKRKYGRNRYDDMSKKRNELKECQKNHHGAKKSQFGGQ